MTPVDAPPATAGRPRTARMPDRDRTADAMLRERAVLPADHPDRTRLRRHAIEASLPWAAALARRYADRGEPLADLRQVAFVGLVKAVDGFDPAQTTDFWAYATPTITGELKRHFRDNGWAVRVPRRYKDLQQQVNRCRDDLIQRLCRVPGVADFAEHLDADRDDVARALEAEHAYSPNALAQAGRDDRPSVLDTTGARDPGYEVVELHEMLHPALAGLSWRERRIITLRFFYDLTQSEIAAEVGLSQMHVSRLIARILRRLRRALRDPYATAP